MNVTNETPLERVAYFNGSILPESEVRLPLRDRGFKYGDAVFDMTRTFGHRIFKLKEHVDRLYQSLRYVGIEPEITPTEMIQRSEEVLAKNLPLIGKDDDYWVGQRITRGIDVPEGDPDSSHDGPNVIIECTPLPLAQRARLYRDGIDIVIPAIRRVGPESLSPRVKSHNYLNLIMADLEAKEHTSESWAILLDSRGFLTEGIGSNLFLVKNGTIRTPKKQGVLGGISRETVLELASASGMPVKESDLDLFDAYTADEMFLTSTSLCICPVRSVQGRLVGKYGAQGPITKQLMDAYVSFVDFDWVSQYLNRIKS